MQGLLHIPQFMEWLKQHNTPAIPCSIEVIIPRATTGAGSGVECPVCTLQTLAREYWEGNPIGGILGRFDRGVWNLARHPIYSLDFLRFIRVGTIFRPRLLGEAGQEDAEEFLRWLLHRIIQNSTTNLTWPDEYEALFATNVRRDATCSECGTRRTTAPSIDEGPILSMAITARPSTLQRCIREYFQPQAPVSIQCTDPRCNNNMDHTEVVSIISAPEILIIQLIRSRFSALTGNMFKVRTPVAADQRLDLTAYQENTNMPLVYSLSSVVSHAGEDLQGGHYIAHTTGPPPNRAISAISDFHCLPSDTATLRQDDKTHRFPGREQERFQNYILFYTRTSNTGVYAESAVPVKRTTRGVKGGRIGKKRSKGKA
ncbi:cysteine proteinase [Mytilinidion resinicola]|uniref:ubiquitinyl hydrolase 1 n=1 Tax=Mytilinidion resinicola TaxID=574789 RepID=A0A6A6YTU0_9PEZI|nr:cysteine proteinase [Mytilinidion resinicola]KAF2811939.1 cysteine proteinase [Mytilinidion resinicola]